MFFKTRGRFSVISHRLRKKTSLISYSGFLNVQLCPNLLLFMHRRLQNMEHTLSQSVDSEHSQFDHEKDTSTVIQNMRFYVRS